MSRRPGSRVRFAVVEELPPEPDPVPTLGPVVFTLPFEGGKVTFDFSDLPCPRLVRALARALCEIAGEDGTRRTRRGIDNFLQAVRDFATFAAAVEADRADQLDLDDLEPEMLDAFEDKLVADYGRAASRPPEEMAALVRLLRLAAEDRPGVMDAAMLIRIAYGMATPSEYVKKPLDAYPLPLFEEIREAALRDVRATRDRILAGERRAAAGTDPDIGGWDKLDNQL